MFYRIEDRMATELKLGGTELLIYGVIYSSQYQTYTRGQETLAKYVWTTRLTVNRILKKMVENKLIEKVSKWYKIVSNWYTEVSKWYSGENVEMYQNDTLNVSKWYTYNKQEINNNIKEEIKEEKIVEEVKEKKPVKKKYLDFVLLTEEEYNKLIDRYWKWIIERKIEDLNNYIWSKGKKYKSHYFTILERLRKENIKPLEKKISPAQTKQTNNNDLHLDTRASWLKEAFPMNK